jgi:uncharacterized Fe-S cluster-containing radical SAM superfamily protein
MSIRSYYCRALHGESDYNICINSDMTVSCNCEDYDGSGHIGDLQEQSFAQVFSGEKAQSFRKMLLQGQLPVPWCKRCPERSAADSKDTDYYLHKYRLPHYGIMAENTALCNLRCLDCRRSELLNTRKRMRMSLGDVELVAKLVLEHDIRTISYFNLGEPFLSPSILDEIKIIRKYNPDLVIITSTNGVLLDTEDKIKAALMMNHIYFSIHGASQESLIKYQVGGNFERSYYNMKNLVQERNRRESPVTIEWKYVVFAHNDSINEIEVAQNLAHQAGVDLISFWGGAWGGADPERILSKRFPDHPPFQNLGYASWKGREVDLRIFPYEYIKLFSDKLNLANAVLGTIKGDKQTMADIISSKLNEPEISTEEYVKKSFEFFLGRYPEEEALNSYTLALDKQRMTRSQLCMFLVDSEEFRAKASSNFHFIKLPK